MKKVIVVVALISSLFFVFVDQVDAIIFLPAIILIPIVKIIAVIIGGFSLPVVAGSAFLNKVKGKSLATGLIQGIVILLLGALILAIILKLVNPDRPLF